nr:nucleotidyltransferase domain-containing protein [uncultured Brevundimonas sp.]
MFEDDRGRLLQIGEWLDAIKQGLVGVNETADEVLWYRLAMVEKSRARLTASYVAAHPDMAALPLPTLDAVLGDPHPSVSESRALAQRTVETFRPLLNDLPPSPPARAFQPSPDTRFDAVVDTLREMEAGLRAQGVAELYLFGSVARREDHAHSDVDIAFVLADEAETRLGLFDQARIARELQEAVGAPVDFVELTGLREDVGARVNRDGVVVFR